MEGAPVQAQRRLSHVLAKVTLFLALLLGAVSGLSQISVDLRQEKDAVQYSAEEFLNSVAPSAASAAYNFYMPAAEQAVLGLFTQRAIKAVTIINEGQVMISREREVERTLPNLGPATQQDLIQLETLLYAPTNLSSGEVIGKIYVTVDRSIVAPAFVNRMLYYFAFATAKNFLLGVLLIWIVYGALARYIVGLAETIARWTPSVNDLKIAPAPRIMRETELDSLAVQITKLAKTATGRIQEAEASQALLSQEVYQKNLKLEEANARLKELAEMDALTGLHNRRSFDRLAEDAVAHATSTVSVAMIDVDFFKAYNDYYGHQAGDRCLITVAEIIRETLDHPEVIVARFGGEEFIALHFGEPAEIETLADAIHRHLAAAKVGHKRSGVSEKLTVSIGLASTPADCASLDEVIANADEALYTAKANGRNQTVVYSDDLRQHAQRAQDEAFGILKAIDQREFEPFIQPQQDAVTGELVGVEALLRRRMDDGSFEAPVAFMEVARANDYLTRIDQIVLEKVSDFLDQARITGVDIPRLALNVPRERILDAGYVADLTKLSENHPTTIALELNENEAIEDHDDTLTWKLDELRDLGIEVDIDHFGAGQTSILRLMHMRPSRVKVATKLVQQVAADEAYAQVVTSIVQISRAVGTGVLAQGVETREVSDRLVSLGCTAQQGFYFARPMPADQFLQSMDRAPTRQSGVG